jgi:hypothetical protein
MTVLEQAVRDAIGALATQAPRELIAEQLKSALDALICGACGQPWTGEKCGQADNGHSYQTCYPVGRESQT